MPKIVLSFGDTLQESGPLSCCFKLRWPVLVVEVADRVPCSTVGFKAVSVTVRRRRNLERPSIDTGDNEDPLSDLRDAVVGGVQVNDL
jgi:hypothetical protein